MILMKLIFIIFSPEERIPLFLHHKSQLKFPMPEAVTYANSCKGAENLVSGRGREASLQNQTLKYLKAKPA